MLAGNKTLTECGVPPECVCVGGAHSCARSELLLHRFNKDVHLNDRSIWLTFNHSPMYEFLGILVIRT